MTGYELYIYQPHRGFQNPRILVQTKTLEEQRAKCLEKVFRKTSLFLDFHQTRQNTPEAFFIFPYSKKRTAFANYLNTSLKIITHWGQRFSKDGMCSDDFVGRSGGIGITVELGRKGLNANQTSLGFSLGKKALEIKKIELIFLTTKLNPLYTWQETILNNDDKHPVILDKGWENFDPVKKHQKLGTKKGNPVLASSQGWIMFPKYEKDPKKRPKEVCRILKKINPSELPTDKTS